MPKGSDPIPTVELFSAEGSTSVAHLASNVDALAGSASFTVPQVTAGSYIVKSMFTTSFSASPWANANTIVGNSASAKFQIVANAVSYLPDIVAPAKDTAWKVGQKATITWCAFSSRFRRSSRADCIHNEPIGINRPFLRTPRSLPTLTSTLTATAVAHCSSPASQARSTSLPAASPSLFPKFALAALT